MNEAAAFVVSCGYFRVDVGACFMDSGHYMKQVINEANARDWMSVLS